VPSVDREILDEDCFVSPRIVNQVVDEAASHVKEAVGRELSTACANADPIGFVRQDLDAVVPIGSASARSTMARISSSEKGLVK
jgi:hypothetical protein